MHYARRVVYYAKRVVDYAEGPFDYEKRSFDHASVCVVAPYYIGAPRTHYTTLGRWVDERTGGWVDELGG